MGTVNVNGSNYTVYGDFADANTYLNGAIGAGPDAWNASTDDDAKARAVVAAFRYLETMRWQGTKTVSSQATQWPRTGVVDGYSVAVDTATVPTDVINAQYELAGIFMADPTVYSALTSGSNVKRVAAKGVDVEFFRPTDVPGSSTKMPVVVQRMVGQYLGSAVSTGGAAKAFNSDEVNGCSKDSAFDDDAILDRTWPWG